MKPSVRLIELIKQFEGFRSKPYLCPAGIPTIGYGSTIYPDGKKVTLKDKPITEEEGKTILLGTMKTYIDAVNRYVQVKLTQGQYDALVGFAYNAGVGALQKSTLLRKVNLKDFAGAANEFDKWVYGGGRKLQGLVKRRAAEKAMFMNADLIY